MKSTRQRSGALQVSDGEFPPWSELREPARRVIELPAGIAGRVLLAYHEAGHAVALCAFGIHVSGAELLPNRGITWRGGNAPPRGAEPTAAFSAAELDVLADAVSIGHAATFLAGAQAELLARSPGTRLHRVIVNRPGTDADVAAAFLADRFEPPVGTHYAQALARSILRAHWRGVEAIARHLYCHGFVTADVIDELLSATACGATIGIDWTLGVVDLAAAATVSG